MSMTFPWRVTDSGVRDGAGYICLIPKPTHYPGQDERYKNEVAERQANAVLISAAPELLAALQALFSSLDPSIAGMDGSVFEQARAAIEKATGAQS